MASLDFLFASSWIIMGIVGPLAVLAVVFYLVYNKRRKKQKY